VFTLWNQTSLLRAQDAFDAVAAVVLEASRQSRKRWKDDRMVWLPLNYGLRRQQYDTQTERDVVVAAVLDRPFSEAGQVQFLINDRWQYELERMIRQTEYYQVLLIHDFKGGTESHPDPIGWGHMTVAYLDALSLAIADIDAGRRDILPQFSIFIDQFYYEKSGGRDILTFLEQLYVADAPDLDDTLLVQRITDAQERLREAVEQSPVLSAWSSKERRRRLKVHINVTNLFDHSYSVDALARDHRKIAYRDIFEDQPQRGLAIVTGQGVGAHYLGPCWDDRSLLIRGTGLVSIKDATRALFLGQGYDSTEVPYYLQPRHPPPDATAVHAQLREQGWRSRFLVVTNGTGFKDKSASVLKATLYNLMLAGDVVVAPDSIWTCDFWSGMLIATALRGCHVVAIGPERRTAASNAPVTLDLMRNTLSTLIAASHLLEDQMAATGGSLHVGLYARRADVQDLGVSVDGLLRAYEAGVDEQRLISLSPSSLDALKSAQRRLTARPVQIEHLFPIDGDCDPKLHLKSQFFVSGAGLEAISGHDWGGFIERYLETRVLEVTGTRDASVGLRPDLLKDPAVHAADTDDPGSAIYYVTVGSHNQDRRSMFLDGEATALVAGEDALVAALDFAFLIGESDWVDSIEELEERYPSKKSLIRRFSQWLRDLI